MKPSEILEKHKRFIDSITTSYDNELGKIYTKHIKRLSKEMSSSSIPRVEANIVSIFIVKNMIQNQLVNQILNLMRIINASNSTQLMEDTLFELTSNIDIAYKKVMNGDFDNTVLTV